MKNGQSLDTCIYSLQQRIELLEKENAELLAKNTNNELLKEAKAESSQARVLHAEQVSELKCEISSLTKQVEKLTTKLTESEALLSIKDEQIEASEEILNKIHQEKDSEDEEFPNYYAELIGCKVKYNTLYSQNKMYEAKLHQQYEIVEKQK